tara:strand:+ start:1150 stop:1536 length:387 start_codon:yes stop_codon:yes gene_type:complete
MIISLDYKILVNSLFKHLILFTMETLKDLRELKDIKVSFDRKRAGVLFNRLLTEYFKHNLSLIFNDKGKVNGFYMISSKTGKPLTHKATGIPLKHKIFIKGDKLMCTCSKFGKQVVNMDIYIPSINRL